LRANGEEKIENLCTVKGGAGGGGGREALLNHKKKKG